MAIKNAAANLKKFMEKRVCIHLHDKVPIIGVLRGYDNFSNVVLDNAIEYGNNERNELGMVVIRGSSVIWWECLDCVKA